MKFAAWLFAALVVPGAVGAQPAAKPLSGTYTFAGKTLVDPPPAEPRDSHLVITLDGQTARDVYRKMKERPRRDACLDDGSMSKTSGGMHCTEWVKPARYTCAFSINLAAQKIEGAAVC
jgi:hypothetical protein